MNKRDLVQIREALPGDVNFIFATWLRGLYFGNDWFREIPQDHFFSVYHKVLEGILTRPGTSVQVACLKEDPDVVLAYCVLESKKDGRKLHWVHTKQAWRRLGLARDIIPNDVNEVSHLTAVGRSIKQRKEWVFNPFL